MADKASQLVLDALHRAVEEPAGVPLFSQKASPGLFAGTTMAKQAAQRCKEQDLLRVVRTAPRGKVMQEVVAITPKGLDHLISQSDARHVLEDLVRGVEARDQQLRALIASAHAGQSSLAGLRDLAATVLQQLGQEQAQDPLSVIENGLREWRASRAAEDCPLPHLYRQSAKWTIGQFHDALRQLQTANRIYLHPWTGPLSELPEPHLALMAGHEIAYYASWRDHG